LVDESRGVEDAAVAVGGVLAEADVAGDEEGGEEGFELLDGENDGGGRGVSSGASGVLQRSEVGVEGEEEGKGEDGRKRKRSEKAEQVRREGKAEKK
jgi:hypothetical protein